MTRRAAIRSRKAGKASHAPGGAANQWQLQGAKARFSEVFRRALITPQEIRRHGRDRVVMISAYEFARLKATRKAGNLVELMQNSPLHGIELTLRRERDYGRSIEL